MRHLLFTALALIFTTAVFATNPFVLAGKQKSILVDLTQWAGKSVTLSIKNEAGAILHTAQLSAFSGSRVYNLKNLDNGSYTIAIEDGKKISFQNFSINEIVQVNPKAINIFRPSVIKKGNLVFVNSLLLGKDATITLRDEDGLVLHRIQAQNQPSFGKIYDTSKLRGTKLYVSVNTAGEEFMYSFDN
jgi:hypothetical protein